MQILKFTFLLVVLSACGSASKKIKIVYPSLPDYDLSNPVMIHLKTELDEISGIAYYAKDSSIFAISDELGILYKIYLRKNITIKKWKFAGDGDYEDLVLHDSIFYVLQSNGTVKSIHFLEKNSAAIEQFTLPMNGHNNFETMYFDGVHDKIVMICKECQGDHKNNVSAYDFNYDEQTFRDRPFFSIDTKNIGRQLGNNKIKFKPSAAAIHPVTHDLYIVSSVAKGIAVASPEGKVKEVYGLDPALFKQPEGITFTPAGDLIISNESAEAGAPNLLIFKYKPLPDEKD